MLYCSKLNQTPEGDWDQIIIVSLIGLFLGLGLIKLWSKNVIPFLRVSIIALMKIMKIAYDKKENDIIP